MKSTQMIALACLLLGGSFAAPVEVEKADSDLFNHPVNGTIDDIDAELTKPLTIVKPAGEITYYYPSKGTGACEWQNSDSEHVVALSVHLMGQVGTGGYCGKKVAIQRGNRHAVGTVVDKCMGCKVNDIDLSPALFDKLAEFWEGRVPATWNFI